MTCRPPRIRHEWYNGICINCGVKHSVIKEKNRLDKKATDAIRRK